MGTDIKQKRVTFCSNFPEKVHFHNNLLYICQIQKRTVKFEKTVQNIDQNKYQLEIIYEIMPFIQETRFN